MTIQMFMDALLGTAPKALKNLNADSNLMIYITGHGGNQFFKFQDEVRVGLLNLLVSCKPSARMSLMAMSHSNADEYLLQF